MADPYFKLRQEVHVVRNHCASCSDLDSQMQHPIKVRAIMAYGEGSTYRIASKMRRVHASISMKHASAAVLRATSRIRVYSVGSQSCRPSPVLELA